MKTNLIQFTPRKTMKRRDLCPKCAAGLTSTDRQVGFCTQCKAKLVLAAEEAGK